MRQTFVFTFENPAINCFHVLLPSEWQIKSRMENILNRISCGVHLIHILIWTMSNKFMYTCTIRKILIDAKRKIRKILILVLLTYLSLTLPSFWPFFIVVLFQIPGNNTANKQKLFVAIVITIYAIELSAQFGMKPKYGAEIKEKKNRNKFRFIWHFKYIH